MGNSKKQTRDFTSTVKQQLVKHSFPLFGSERYKEFTDEERAGWRKGVTTKRISAPLLFIDPELPPDA